MAEVSQEVIFEVEIAKSLGLHARPAAEIVKLVQDCDCTIFFTKEHLRVNAKSVMSILMLGAGHGSFLTVEVQGPDASKAAERVRAYLESPHEAV